MRVRTKEKGQVPIPAALRLQIHAETGDLFEANDDGVGGVVSNA
jgi:bifunctional DNA-binding transcriptional regulator/antitoxin component of YhaV-PrlF toxin-antitoxin module